MASTLAVCVWDPILCDGERPEGVFHGDGGIDRVSKVPSTNESVGLARSRCLPFRTLDAASAMLMSHLGTRTPMRKQRD